MAAVRKSPVSATGNWFKRGSNPSLGKKRVRGLAVPDAAVLAPEASLIPPKRQRHSAKNVWFPANTKIQNSPPQKFPHLSVVSTAKAAPLWLVQLYKIHRYSSIVGFFLVAGTLAVYGFTVYTQELWSQNYHRLQKLQRDERQITTTNATLTNKMAQEAELQSAGLISPTPARTIFLSPVPHNSVVGTLSTKSNSQTQPPTSSPMGY